MADRLRSLGFVVLCLAAAFSGALIGGRTHAEIGPFDATTSLRMSLRGDTVVRLAPLGSLRLDTHDGPLELAVSADEVDAAEARELIEGGVGLAEFQAEIAADARRAVTTTAARATAGAVAASVGVALLRGGGRRRVVAGLAAAAVVVTGCGAAARLSWQPRAFAQPTYSGLLEIAPQAIGSLEDVRAQYDAYRAQLTALIANLSSLYQAASDLPDFSPRPRRFASSTSAICTSTRRASTSSNRSPGSSVST